MSKALHVVICSRSRWWVDIEGQAHGPYDNRETAAVEAKQLAEYTTHMGRESEVLVPDDTGRYRVTWASADDRRHYDGTHRAAE